MKKQILLSAIIIAFTSYSSLSQVINWKFQTQGRVYATPAVSGDIVLIGSGDSTFYAVSKKTGKQIWNYKADGAIHSSPCVVDNFVFFGTTGGSLYALNIETGNLSWKFDSGGEKMLDVWDYYISSPCAYNGFVYWGSGDGFLYAIDCKTGNLVWKFKANGIIHATPLAYDDKVYFGDFSGYFYSLNAINGDINWQFRTIGDTYFPNGEIQKGATLNNGIIYFGSRDYNIYALSAKTGRGHWNMKELGSWVIAEPLVYKEYIYVGTSDTHRFYCLSKVNGKIVWQIPLPMRVYGSAIEQNGIIYFGCFDGILRGVDYKTGEIRWQFQTEASKANYSKIFDTNGKFKEGFELFGKDYLESERLIHSLGAILSTPVINENVIFFGSSDGGLYSVKISTE
jgi:eukaryotic-like serine/threonine-protein kinase